MDCILFVARDLVRGWLLGRTWSTTFPATSILMPTAELEDLPETIEAYVMGGKEDRTPIARDVTSVICEIHVEIHRRMDPRAPGDGRAEAMLLEEIAAASDSLELAGPDGEILRVLSATIETTADPELYIRGVLAGSVLLRVEHHIERNV